jgi:hypothetical protein
MGVTPTIFSGIYKMFTGWQCDREVASATGDRGWEWRDRVKDTQVKDNQRRKRMEALSVTLMKAHSPALRADPFGC